MCARGNKPFTKLMLIRYFGISINAISQKMPERADKSFKSIFEDFDGSARGQCMTRPSPLPQDHTEYNATGMDIRNSMHLTEMVKLGPHR